MRRLLPPSLVLMLAAGQAAVTALPTPTLHDGPWRWSGPAVIVSGAALTLTGARQFARRRTNIVTFDDPDVLVDDGLFAITRNPMYVGFTLMLVGGAVLSGAWLAWLGPVGFFAAADLWYIPFEEARMRAVFGDEYERYGRRVGRWLRRFDAREVTA